jgi:hypothetical protein
MAPLPYRMRFSIDAPSLFVAELRSGSDLPQSMPGLDEWPMNRITEEIFTRSVARTENGALVYGATL